MQVNRVLSFLAVPLGLFAFACSSSPNGTGGGTTSSSSGGTGGTTQSGGTSSGGTTSGGTAGTGGMTTGGSGGSGAGGSGGMTTGGSGGSGAGGTGGMSAVERGKYLVDSVIDCGQCHTPRKPDGSPDSSLYLAGSPSYVFQHNGMDVTVSAGNITQDMLAGLGTWADAQIKVALQSGVDDEMASLWPIMPYPAYARLTPDDAAAIVAYLKTVQGSSNAAPEDTLADPDPPASAIPDAMIPHTTLDPASPEHESAERGRYLATIACLSCHTPEKSPGVPDMSKAFAGGRTFKRAGDAGSFTSTNITPDATGIAGWKAADVVQGVKSGVQKMSLKPLCGGMPAGPGKMGDMTVEDLTDIGNYLTTLPPINNGPFKCQP
jgi:mono/diheme cytochrome c family protein